MDKDNLAAFTTTTALIGSSILLWKKLFKPGLQLMYYELKEIPKFISLGKRMMHYIDAYNDIIGVFERTLKFHANKTMVVFEGRSYTFADANRISNQMANFFLMQGIKPNDVVALVISNSPEFIWIFLALRKIGAVPSLLNHSLQGKGLIHSIRICDPRMILVDTYKSIQKNVYNVKDEMKGIPIFAVNTEGDRDVIIEEPTWPLLNRLIEDASDEPISPEHRSSITHKDNTCYIYTSGTTGLPKAVNFYVLKSITLMSFVSPIMESSSNTIIYLALPLYHTSGLAFGLLHGLDSGAKIILKRKFTASKFWSDCCEHNVTFVPYIGEFCRYILAQPDYPHQKSHKVKIFCGNGLGRDIWQEFKERYRIPKIIELYGSTEGNCFLINLQNKIGAIGRLSPLMNMLRPNKMYLVKYDLDSAQPIRNENGRCIPVNEGEVGLLIGKCIPETDFQMYKNRKDLDEAKFIRNVFVEGDKYFNSGDLLYMDSDYFAYFSDRIGDTFRWKGENVSTLEVANVFRELDFINDANIYGVKFANYPGRVGMASLLFSSGKHHATDEQLAQMYEKCQKSLPSYAIPHFLRIQSDMNLTGTFKLQKRALQEEGFNPNLVCDPLYYISPTTKSYVPLTKDAYTQICIGKSKL